MLVFMWLWRAKYCYDNSVGRFSNIPPYSTDFSPCEYHIFCPLKKALKGLRFSDDNEIQSVVGNWFHNQHRNFFAQGIHRVVDHWDICPNLLGDFVYPTCYVCITTITLF
ncbi:hypothetical protein TNCV_1206711 [Trichonephila clavipes]|nr:hypothetical protein TNCV_1206711 [Trichonephila clavipes]